MTATKRNDIPEYAIWKSIRKRCSDKSNPEYKHYAGRGISICARWDDFARFLEDVGPRPSKDHSIDRIDVNGNYEPSNCRWATKSQQNRNRRDTTYLTLGTETKDAKTWSEILGMPYYTLRGRIAYGWDDERILTEPVDVTKRKRSQNA